MKEFKIPYKLIALLRTVLEHAKYRIKMQNNQNHLE
jgi:hypothetical protein